MSKEIKSSKSAKSYVKDMKFMEGIEEVYVTPKGYVYYSHSTAENHSKGKIFTVKIK